MSDETRFCLGMAFCSALLIAAAVYLPTLFYH